LDLLANLGKNLKLVDRRVKTEEHTIFWPDQTEFVRMAAQFNATIVAFGVVGEDDLLNVKPFV
jgi:hypothetical protein